jgi:RNA polymerase sigma-70 factor (ECF subfamily)
VVDEGGREVDAEASHILLERVREGDSEALSRLLERYMPALMRWARGRMPHWARDVSDTQDLVQDTVIQVMKHLQTFQPQRPGALQAYLRQALVNKIRDEVRRATRRPPPGPLPETMVAQEPSPLQDAIGRETLEHYDAALEELSDVDREAIIGRLELGQSYEELAAILEKPSPDAARVAVHRAVRRLAEKMKPHA